MLDKQGFDLWADGYDKAVGLSDTQNTFPFAGYKSVLASIFKQVMNKRNTKILDIGFGTGTLTTKLYEQGCDIYGQDFSSKMIELAQKKMPESHLFQGDFTKGLARPLLEQNYDVIIATYSLHHLKDEQKSIFIKQLLGLLNEDGQILIGDVIFTTRKQLEQCHQQAKEEWDEDEYYFVYDELCSIFPQCSFEKHSFCAGVLKIGKGVN